MLHLKQKYIVTPLASAYFPQSPSTPLSTSGCLLLFHPLWVREGLGRDPTKVQEAFYFPPNGEWNVKCAGGGGRACGSAGESAASLGLPWPGGSLRGCLTRGLSGEGQIGLRTPGLYSG